MQITNLIMPKSQYVIKCPYAMIPEFVIAHETANDASAMAEASYMEGNSNYISFHEVVDDYRVVHCIDFDKNSFNAGDGRNGKGNRKGIAIEICYSKSGGERYEQARRNGAKRIAQILKQYGWGIDRVKKHQDFSGKYCPHRTLDEGWDKFVNMVREEMGEVVRNETVSNSMTQPNKKIDVKYQAYADKWYPDVINTNDHAGTKGKAICGFRGNTIGSEAEAGKLIYCVGLLNGRWLGEITDRERCSNGDNFAGILGKPIDRIMIRATKGQARVRVRLLGAEDFLPWVTGYNKNDDENGYAGIKGRKIDAIQVEIV